jgi:DNA modification methylase
LSLHPTVKPIQLLADAIKDCSKKGGLVLDCFGGSGSTLIAAHQTGRRARLVELDPKYVDVAIRRYQAETGQDVSLCGSGRSFADIAENGR